MLVVGVGCLGCLCLVDRRVVPLIPFGCEVSWFVLGHSLVRLV